MISRGKAGLQQRAVQKNGWTKERRTLFLEELSVSCNVWRAARAVGRSASTAYRLRQRDEGFALLWAQAIDDGVERLKERLLAHSLGQETGEDNPDDLDLAARQASAPFDAARFDPAVAMGTLRTLATLSRQGGRAVGKPSYATDAEVNVMLLERLQALARKAAKRGGAPEGGRHD